MLPELAQLHGLARNCMDTPQPPALDSARAWIVSLAAFVASFVAYGFLYAFGAFLKPMGSALGVNHAVMASLFSCMSLSGYLLGPFTGDWPTTWDLAK